MKIRLEKLRIKATKIASAVALGLLAVAAPAQAAWEPTKAVEFVVPAGTGGGADQMARLIQGIVIKHKLMKEPLIVVNKSGGAGAEGFLEIKGAKGDPHKIVVTLSNLFTTPLATGVPFNWRDMTPVSMMALDQFVLWVNAESPFKTANEYLIAVKAAGPNKMKMGGTGSKQEDQIITVGIEKATGTKFIYIPFKGGGEVTDTMSWGDIPTCKESGVPTEYTMLRGVFMPPGVTKEQTDFYVNLLKKVRDTPEWKDYMEKGALNQTVMSGDEFGKWLGTAENRHRDLMKEAGFIAK